MITGIMNITPPGDGRPSYHTTRYRYNYQLFRALAQRRSGSAKIKPAIAAASAAVGHRSATAADYYSMDNQEIFDERTKRGAWPLVGGLLKDEKGPLLDVKSRFDRK